MMKVLFEGLSHDVKQWKFPCGEVGVRIPEAHTDSMAHIVLQCAIQNSDDFMAMLMAVDAINSMYEYNFFTVRIGYLPYGRQDRICNPGEALSIRVVMNILNSLDVTCIELFDLHSPVAEALAKPGKVYTYSGCGIANEFGFSGKPGQVLVAPDAGAEKRLVKKYVYGYDSVVVGDKVRDLSNGNITHYSISGDVKDKECVVIDDICDGGATFILLGQALKAAGASKITLFITHGVFTKGTKELTELYDYVYTTNSYHMDRIGDHDGVHYFDLL